MKKIIMIFSMVAMLFVLTACGEKAQNIDNSNSDLVGNNVVDKVDEEQNYDSPLTLETVLEHPVTSTEYFRFDDMVDSYFISQYTGDDTVVVIPSEYNGKPVTEMSSYMFANDSIVRAVVIPDTIKTISYRAFINNSNIEIVICKGAVKVKESAFHNCMALHTIVLSDALTEIEQYAFAAGSKLREIYISPNVTEIPQKYSITVFMHCTNLTIKGKSGSYIETFAKEQGIPFVAE